MLCIEFAWMPRSGKTSALKTIISSSNKFLLHEERFDLVPFSDSSSYEFNIWYAKYCAKRISEAKDINAIHLFDRWILDRIAFGIALKNFWGMKDSELREYLSCLEPYIPLQDYILLFNPTPNDSLNRAIWTTKNTLTRNIDFLACLHESYKILSKKYNNIYSVPEKFNSKDIQDNIIGFLERNKLSDHF